MENILEIKNLHVQYETSEDINFALNGIDLKIQKGETVGLVGETGAGKTTIALSILGLLQPGVGVVKGGEIIFEGRDLLKLDTLEMRKIRGDKISMIFQDPMSSLNPVLTVGEQIAEAIALHRTLSKEEVGRLVDETLELVGIPKERKHEYPHQFSGGMKQRVIIAIALSTNPDLLIADEPTTALDVTIQAQVLNLMDELRQKMNMSMLLITHDLGIVAQNCDHVGIIYAGEIVEFGTVYEVFDKTKEHHPYTNGLFGSIPDLTTHAKRLTPVRGLMADPADLPEGCSFHPRCDYCGERCGQEVPRVCYMGGEHYIKCHSCAEKEVQA